MKPIIFISHSTKSTEAMCFLKCVEEALKEEFDVRLDVSELKAGDDWRQRLYQCMDEAHGAVLLITKDAIRSNFVSIEASVFSWRWAIDPNFALLPILVGDVAFDDLKAGVLGALALDVLQIPRVDPADLPDAAAKILTALKRFRARFPRPRTPLERLEHSLCKELERTDLDVLTLDEISRQTFGLSARLSGNRQRAIACFVGYLLRADRDSACTAILRLADSMLVPTRPVIDAVAPMWIALERALPIAETVFEVAEKRQLLLDTEERLVVELFICRAFCRPLPAPAIVIPILPPSGQDTLVDVASQITAALSPRPSAFSTPHPAQVKTRLRQCERRHLPVLLLFGPEFVPDDTLIRQLRGEFPTLTLFILTRRAAKHIVESLRSNATVLTALDPEEEQSIVADYYVVSSQPNALQVREQ